MDKMRSISKFLTNLDAVDGISIGVFTIESDYKFLSLNAADQY
jgi:hypothetical protein